jgi:hypothetical protein
MVCKGYKEEKISTPTKPPVFVTWKKKKRKEKRCQIMNINSEMQKFNGA